MKARRHGTRACYLAGCKRPECARAHYAYEIARQRAIISGQWQPWTDAGPARDHVGRLVATGLTETNIARLAGVRQGTVYRLLHGCKGNPPSRRIRPEASRAILAVHPDVPPAGTVDATGTRRRLQALVACGWTQSQLAARLGMKPTNLSAMLRGFRGQKTVLASTAIAVRGLYARLWDVPPPESAKREGAQARAARLMAAARGWPPPMAWDDEAIDDPRACPGDGWQRSGRLTGAEMAGEAAEAIAWEGSRAAAADRLGVKKATLDTCLARAQRGRPAGPRDSPGGERSAGDKDAGVVSIIRLDEVRAESSHDGLGCQRGTGGAPGTCGYTESARPEAGEGAQRAGSETVRMQGRDQAPDERHLLSYSEVIDAWQRANGRPAPMSLLQRWAHNGVSDAERNSHWYQAGGSPILVDTVAVRLPSPGTWRPLLEAEPQEIGL